MTPSTKLIKSASKSNNFALKSRESGGCLIQSTQPIHYIQLFHIFHRVARMVLNINFMYAFFVEFYFGTFNKNAQLFSEYEYAKKKKRKAKLDYEELEKL